MECVWQVLIAVLVAIVTVLLVLKLYLESIKGKCTSTVDLSGKVAIVTGANTGIGYFTALDFAKRNARVILACRDLQRGRAAVEKIRLATGNEDVVVIQLDLSMMKCVREFAEKINKQESRLDILVNNAGMAGLPLTMTDEGFELMFASNYFGHFLLTNLLLGLLEKSETSRVINVSSMAHKWSKGIKFENLKAEKSYNIRKCYSDTKLANVLFTRELARRLEGTEIITLCLHPGPVNTRLLHNAMMPALKPLHFIAACFLKTPEEGAQTSIYCAVSEELEGVSGKYYTDCREAEEESSDLSKDMGLAKKLWEISEKYTGLVES